MDVMSYCVWLYTCVPALQPCLFIVVCAFSCKVSIAHAFKSCLTWNTQWHHTHSQCGIKFNHSYVSFCSGEYPHVWLDEHIASYQISQFIPASLGWGTCNKIQIKALRGNCTPNQKLACFVCYLKIINTFLKNDICIWKQIVKGSQKWPWNFSWPSGFKLWIKTVKIMFLSITQEPLGLLKC